MKRLEQKFRFLLIRMVVPAILKAIFSVLPRNKNTLLLVKNDGIGDYMLFRNYFEVLKRSDKYSGYNIYLLGNTAFSDLAPQLDAETVTGFFGYNDSFFLKWDWVKLLFKLQCLRPEVIIYTNYSRKYAVDRLIKMVNTGKRIAVDGDTLNESAGLKHKSDRFYDELIQVSDLPAHETERNRQIIEALTGQKCRLQKTHIQKAKLNVIAGEKIIVFPGGSEIAKRWPAENFNSLCKQLWQKLNLHIVLAGGKADMEDAKLVKEGIATDHITDTTGMLTLMEVCALIAGAKLLITNDTVAVHIAAATGTPVICIAKGDLFGRFIPYPPASGDNIFAVFPPGLNENVVSYYHWSPLDINGIAVESVYSAVESVLAETKTRLN